MDRSFSQISGVEIETVAEIRKSSNIASAVIFQQSESDVNLFKKEQKAKINQAQEANAQEN